MRAAGSKHATAADAPLRRDVRLLGDELGRVLVEQDGPELLEAVETVRRLSREAREHGDELRRAALQAAVAGLDPARQADVLRAFGVYFQLANLAEQHHRQRRRRDSARKDGAPRESLAAAFERLAAAGVTGPELAQATGRISLELVLTAHPTESARRGVLATHQRLSELLERLDRGDPVADELAEEITLLWQSDEVRPARPRVSDEIRHGLWFFESSLLEAAERVLAAYREGAPEAPCPLRFGTWIGGDADGNPAAGPETISEALTRARALAIGAYRDEVRELARSLAVSTRIVPSSSELLASVAGDEDALAGYVAEIGRRNAEEPYRRKLSFVWRRLGNSLQELTSPATPPPRSSPAISICSTAACGRIAAGGSPTAASRGCGGGSSCSASRSPSSMSACTPTICALPTIASTGSSAPSSTSVRSTDPTRSTRSSSRAPHRPRTCSVSSSSHVSRCRSSRSSRRSPTSAPPPPSSPSSSRTPLRARRSHRGDGRLLGLR